MRKKKKGRNKKLKNDKREREMVWFGFFYLMAYEPLLVI